MDADLGLLFVSYVHDLEQFPARVRSLSRMYLFPLKLQVVAHMKQNGIYRRTYFSTLKNITQKK